MRILQLRHAANGKLVGRVIAEAMPGGVTPKYAVRTLRSEPSETGLRTVLEYQVVGATRYFDAAGFPGRTVGLRDTRRSSSGVDATDISSGQPLTSG